MLGLVAAAATLAAADVPSSAVELPADTLLLLVAPWCAPCWDELQRIDALTKSAAPLRLRVLMMEDGAKAHAMSREIAPGQEWLPAASDQRQVRAALWMRTPGLPFSVATDGQGKICAEHSGGLIVDQARRLARACAPRTRSD